MTGTGRSLLFPACKNYLNHNWVKSAMSSGVGCRLAKMMGLGPIIKVDQISATSEDYKNSSSRFHKPGFCLNPPEVCPSLIHLPPFRLLKNVRNLATVHSPFVQFTRELSTAVDWDDFTKNEYVKILTSNSTIDAYIKSETSVLVMFYAPWCHHCKSSKPEFSKAAYILHTKNPQARMAAVDCIRNPEVYEKYDLTGYPTFKYFYQGREVGEYTRKRQASEFVAFMLKNPTRRSDL